MYLEMLTMKNNKPKSISFLDFDVLCSRLKKVKVTEYIGIALKTDCGGLSICGWQRYGFIMQIKSTDFLFTNHQLRQLQLIINKHKKILLCTT